MKLFRIGMLVLTILLVMILGIAFYYNYQTAPVSRDSEKVIVEIKNGSISSIGDTLKENKLIKSTFIFKIYVRLNKINSLKASTYELNRNMNLKTIIDILEKGNSYNPDEIKITFKEGLNVRKIAMLISENTNNSYDDTMKIINDNAFIDEMISKYWFLDDKIKNSKIYYPLEGYLFPETYAFLNKDVSVKDIIDKMLSETDKKLSKYKEIIDKSEYNIHELITLASIVELEGASSNDRASVAGVFYNRLKDNWVLGSDVTTYYYLKIDDFKTSLNGNKNLYTCDGAYNTRCTSFVGLPVGPISNPGLDSLEAVINYKKHDYYYFVADCNKKTYLNKDATGHYNTINKLKNENNWCA